MRLSIIYLFFFALLSEHWLFIGVAHIKISYIFALLVFFIRLDETLYVFRREGKTLIIYIFIILGIVFNDLYVGVDFTNIVNSIFFHIVSFYIFIFFLYLFSKDELNFPKYLIIFAIILIFYKNQEYLLDLSRILEPAYFNSRLASLTLYLAIGLSFFIMLKLGVVYAHIVLLCFFLILYIMEARSTASILLMVLIVSILTSYIRVGFFSFLITGLSVIFIVIFCTYYFYPGIINTIILARIDTFSSLMYFLNTFPFGIGSRGVVDLVPHIENLSNYFGFSLDRVQSASNNQYSTSHSFLIGSLFKNGVLASLPLFYLIFNIFKLNIKLIVFNGTTGGNNILSIFIICSMSYTMFFSGYGQFLTQFPVLYAATIAMYRKNIISYKTYIE